MDREDLTFAVVALEARVQSLAPALDVLAATEAARLRRVAAVFRAQAQGHSPAMFAADQLDQIAQWGSGALRWPAKPETIDFCQRMRVLLAEQPRNRRARRSEEAEDRHRRRMARNEKLRDLAKAHEGATRDGKH